MAAVKKTDIPEIGKFMVDFWEYIKAVWKIEDCETYWDDVFQRAKALLRQYDDPFCRGQVLCFLDYLDKNCRLHKEGRSCQSELTKHSGKPSLNG